MIRITVELIPFGVGPPETLGTIVIANDGSGTPARGNYWFKITGRGGRYYRGGEVRGFPRKRLLVWDLLYRVLEKVVGERNP